KGVEAVELDVDQKNAACGQGKKCKRNDSGEACERTLVASRTVEDCEKRQEGTDPESHAQGMEKDRKAADDLRLGCAGMSAHGQRHSKSCGGSSPKWLGGCCSRPSKNSEAQDERGRGRQRGQRIRGRESDGPDLRPPQVR